MHRFSTPLNTALLAGALAGCGSDARDGNARNVPEATRSDAFRVALLTPGPVSDQSWNAAAYRGLQWIRDTLGARVSHIQTRTPADFEENFRAYGAQGYDLVFGHGFEFQDAAIRVAPDHPGTIYVITSGISVRENVAGIRFGFEDPSYLAGLVAGGMTRTGTIGAIGGTELPPVKSSFEAFVAGARAARPDVRVLTAFVGNWDDVSAGKEQALAQIARGADMIFQNADAAGLGVFQAARESPNVLAFGSNADQNAVAPDVIIGSVVIDIPEAMLHVAREVREGRFRPRVIRLGSPARVTRFVENPALAARIPADTRRLVDSVRALMDANRLTFAPGGVESDAAPAPAP